MLLDLHLDTTTRLARLLRAVQLWLGEEALKFDRSSPIDVEPSHCALSKDLIMLASNLVRKAWCPPSLIAKNILLGGSSCFIIECATDTAKTATPGGPGLRLAIQICVKS